MKLTIRKELTDHILDLINDKVITDENIEDAHYHAFNEDYYLIGYYQCSQWLKKHNIDTFEAIEICQTYEKDNFGESKIYDDSEKTVNMLAYIFGEQLLTDLSYNTVDELKDCLAE